ncbi:MAG TPA: FecR domain-containing protein [Alphaproteobacteria bacterium]|jgi:hypothetical protein
MRASTAFVTAALLFAASSPAFGESAPRIGAAAIIDKAVSGSLGTTERELKRGDAVFQDETITTGKESNAQLLFTDETALTMGPDSKVVLDRLVYDPDKKSGELSLRAVSGAFRFVSGSGPKEGYTIKTPAGTIGVRGTIVSFNIVQSLAGTIVTLTLYEGITTFCITPTQCSELNKPGTYIIIAGGQFSAQQVLNAIGCGAGRCNDASYNQGDQTTYVSFFAGNNVTSPLGAPGAPGENQYQIALRAFVQHLLAKVERAVEHKHLHGWRLQVVLHKIDRLNEKVDALLPALDTQQELWRDKRIVRFHVDRIFNVIYRHHHRFGFYQHHHRHHRRHHRHRHHKG